MLIAVAGHYPAATPERRRRNLGATNGAAAGVMRAATSGVERAL